MWLLLRRRWDVRFEALKKDVHDALDLLRREMHDDRSSVQKQLVEMNATLSKLASARLLQQTFTGLVLGALFVLIYHILGG